MKYLIDFGYWLGNFLNVLALPLLGIAGTLLGVIFANRANARNLTLSLESSAFEKKIDRKNDLRRPIYLDFIEEMTLLSSYLGTLNTVNNAKVNIFYEARKFFAIASKVGLISEDKTSILVTKLSSLYGAFILDATLKMEPHSSLLSDLDSVDEFYRQNQLEIQRLLSEIAQVREAALYDEIRHKRLNESFDFHAGRTRELIDQRTKLSIEYKVAMLIFNKFLISALEPLRPVTIDTCVALRSELGIETDIDAYRTVQEEAISLIKNKVDAVHDAVERM